MHISYTDIAHLQDDKKKVLFSLLVSASNLREHHQSSDILKTPGQPFHVLTPEFYPWSHPVHDVKLSAFEGVLFGHSIAQVFEISGYT